LLQTNAINATGISLNPQTKEKPKKKIQKEMRFRGKCLKHMLLQAGNAPTMYVPCSNDQK